MGIDYSGQEHYVLLPQPYSPTDASESFEFYKATTHKAASTQILVSRLGCVNTSLISNLSGDGLEAYQILVGIIPASHTHLHHLSAYQNKVTSNLESLELETSRKFPLLITSIFFLQNLNLRYILSFVRDQPRTHAFTTSLIVVFMVGMKDFELLSRASLTIIESKMKHKKVRISSKLFSIYFPISYTCLLLVSFGWSCSCYPSVALSAVLSRRADGLAQLPKGRFSENRIHYQRGKKKKFKNVKYLKC